MSSGAILAESGPPRDCFWSKSDVLGELFSREVPVMPKVVNIEPTPNPDALKFIVQRPILRSGTRSFRDFAAAVGDPLGSRLFALGKVTSVFYMDRFVTVNKERQRRMDRAHRSHLRGHRGPGDGGGGRHRPARRHGPGR